MLTYFLLLLLLLFLLLLQLKISPWTFIFFDFFSFSRKGGYSGGGVSFLPRQISQIPYFFLDFSRLRGASERAKQLKYS